MSGEHIIHVYGAVPDVDVTPPETGVAGVSVEVVGVGELAIVYSVLDAAEYGEEVWREHAEDPRWLSAFAGQHHAVLEALLARTDVLPFRLPTLYKDVVAMRAALRREAAALRRRLGAVAHHVEWGAQVFQARAPEERPAPRPRNGQEYLRRRSEESRRRQQAQDQRHDSLLDAHGCLAAQAAQSVITPCQDPAVSGRREPMLLNSAHLVLRSNEDAFFSAVREVERSLAESGMALEVTGPWPPYNFSHLGDSELQDSP